MNLYRVQAADGRGPWRPGLSKHWAEEYGVRCLPLPIHEAFGLDWLSEIPRGWHAGCACRTLEGLLVWFTQQEQDRLESIGYTPVALSADLIIVENEDQVVFARREPFNVGATRLSWRAAA